MKANTKTIQSYKGFDKNLKCRDEKFVIGEAKSVEGVIKACNNGFHACEEPFAVFDYYPPASSRYCKVEQSGDTDREGNKIASRTIKVKTEIGIPGLVKAQIEYVKANTTTEHTDPKMATAGDSGAATSRGSSQVGENGLAVARGNNVKVKGGIGAVLVICEENSDNYEIKEWRAFVVDGEIIKPDTWYQLKDGIIQEATQEG